MDRGWVRDDDRWVLLDHRGERAEDVTDELVRFTGRTMLNRVLAFDGLPPLPPCPDLACVLERGPQDGRWWFLPLGLPPAGISFARPQPPRVAAAGVRITGLIGGYDRYQLICENLTAHPAGVPYRYRWDPTSLPWLVCLTCLPLPPRPSGCRSPMG